MSLTGRVLVGELSTAINIMQAKLSGGFRVSSPLYFRLRTLRMTFTILSELLHGLDAIHSPWLSQVFACFGLRVRVLYRPPDLPHCCGLPVNVVHMEDNTPGFWSQPKLVNSVSETAVAVAEAWKVIADELGRGEIASGLLMAEDRSLAKRPWEVGRLAVASIIYASMEITKRTRRAIHRTDISGGLALNLEWERPSWLLALINALN